MGRITKILASVSLIVVGGFVVIVMVLSLRAKVKYDKAKREIESSVLTVREMDQATKDLVLTIQSDWGVRASDVNGLHSEALRTVGLDPSVANLAELLSRRMPEYSWLSPAQNTSSALFGMTQSLILPISVDGAVHVSADRRMALVRCGEEVVYLFSDEQSGLRETLYSARLSAGRVDAK